MNQNLLGTRLYVGAREEFTKQARHCMCMCMCVDGRWSVYETGQPLYVYVYVWGRQMISLWNRPATVCVWTADDQFMKQASHCMCMCMCVDGRWSVCETGQPLYVYVYVCGRQMISLWNRPATVCVCVCVWTADDQFMKQASHCMCVYVCGRQMISLWNRPATVCVCVRTADDQFMKQASHCMCMCMCVDGRWSVYETGQPLYVYVYVCGRQMISLWNRPATVCVCVCVWTADDQFMKQASHCMCMCMCVDGRWSVYETGQPLYVYVYVCGRQMISLWNRPATVCVCVCVYVCVCVCVCVWTADDQWNNKNNTNSPRWKCFCPQKHKHWKKNCCIRPNEFLLRLLTIS